MFTALKDFQSKLSKSIVIIYILKLILYLDSMDILYYTLFLPYLTYCFGIWVSSLYVTTVNPLFILQMKIIRII